MRKFLAMAVLGMAVFSLGACGGKGGSDGTSQAAKAAPATEGQTAGGEEKAGSSEEYTAITMKLSTASGETTLTAQAFQDFSDRLSEATEGKVKLDVYCSGVLGNNTEALQGAQMGTVDLAIAQPAGLADMGAKKMNLFSLPYLFDSYNQYYNTLYGEVGETLLKDVTDNLQGLVGFGFLPDGGRCFFTKGKAIRSLEDIKGMKLRVQPYAIDNATADALGFSATPTAFSELYSALQTGIVDGAENPLSGIDGNALYEVSEYLTLDNHTYNTPALIMSQKTWDSLNESTRSLMKELWMETVEEFFKPRLSEYEDGLKEKFTAEGVEIIEITDHGKWVEAVKPVWDEYGEGLEDLIEAVDAVER
ncbi:TRAP transporter substrate-binding protein [Clostridiaceae bacterium]|nr:TRAP transporter substrate-binding protein [Clostridiaceae bacterium]RKI17488.1 TRAP transporter substrate-binding protein [bacterium 1XD21-70]